MKITLKSIVLTTMGLISVAAFTSCSDDDDAPALPSLEKINGYYSGHMTYEIIANVPAPTTYVDEPVVEPVALDFNVADNKVKFDKFPVEALIKAILNTDDVTDIVEAIGDLKYEIPFEAALNEDNTAIMMNMKPEALTITVPLGAKADLVVVVGVASPDKGKFTYADKKMGFKLQVMDAKMGSVNAIEGKTIMLTFDILNTVKVPA